MLLVRSWFFMLLVLCCHLCPAQFSTYQFEHLSAEEGLSLAEVSGLGQDGLGYMWIGTQDGIARFDGQDFKIYRNTPGDSTSLPTSATWSLLADSTGLWIGTAYGLCRYDARRDRFSGDFAVNEVVPAKYGSHSFSFGTMIYDNTGKLWLAAVTPAATGARAVDGPPATGIFCMDVNTGELQILEGIHSNTWSSCKDNEGKLWFGTDGNGAFQVDPLTRTIVKRIDLNKITGFRTLTNGIKQDREGNIWFATLSGLVRYSPHKRDSFKLFTHDPLNSRSLISNQVVAIAESKSGELWIGSHGGISVFNPRSEDFTNLQYDPADKTSLSENRITRLMFDSSGNLWVGHFSTGLDKLASNKGFDIYRVSSNPSKGLMSNSINSVCVDSSNGLWVASLGGGLNYLEESGRHYKVTRSVKAQGGRNTLSSGEILAVTPAGHGGYWVGTEAGMFHFEPSTNTFEKIQVPGIEMAAYSIAEDTAGKVFFGTNGDGLYEYDKFTRTFTAKIPDAAQPATRSSTAFFTIARDRSNRLYPICNYNVLYRYSEKSQRFYPFDVRDTLRLIPEGAMINSAHIDVKNNVWINTHEGLVKLIQHPLGDSSYLVATDLIDQSRGLPNIKINRILEDGRGNLWLGHMAGLSRLDVEGGSITNYDITDGLPGNAFNAAGSKLPDGRLAFGTTEGLVIFHPDSLGHNPNVPNVVLTDIRISNQSVGVKRHESDDEIARDGTFLLDNAVGYTRELTLSYDTKVISFEFAALEYTSPRDNAYRYRLEGFEDKWIDAGHNRSATYTNLNPGRYTFRVTASNNDDVWNEQGVAMALTILPPPWATWWAYSLYVIFVLAVLLAARQQVIRRERLKNEVKLNKLEAEKYVELDALKSRFFANISHEFRTPLTLILAPLEKYLKEEKSAPEKRSEFASMHRSATRLLNLVNQLLDLSRFEAGTMKLRASSGDIVQFVRTVMSEFQSISDSRNIEFRLLHDDEVIEMFFDHDKMGKILNNLLSNAFKFTPEGHAIAVIIDRERPQSAFVSGCVRIRVRDTGIGISPVHIDKIFDRFYQVDGSLTRNYDGSGIGLALTKELVELSHGTISVESEALKGSTFTLRFPLGAALFRADELVETAENGLQPQVVSPPTEEEVVDGNKSERVDRTSLLVIEDNPDLRAYLRKELSSSYHVHEAANGAEGIAIAMREIPAIVVSDLMMPVKDGTEVCRVLKEHQLTSHIPIILLTAKSDIESRLDGYKKGADDYIAKPFQMIELSVRIENLLANRKKLQAKFAQVLTLRPSQIEIKSADDLFLKKVAEVVERHMSDPAFGLDTFAVAVCMSKMQLYRKLTALTGYGPNEFIRHFRLERANDLLRANSGNVADVAYQVGFKNLSYFSKTFKEKFDRSPSEVLRE